MKKRHLLQAVYVVLGLMMCIPKIEYAKSEDKKAAPGTAIFVMALMPDQTCINEYIFQYQKEGLHLEMHIPQFNCLPDTGFQRQLNNELLQSAKKRKKETIQLAKSYNQDVASDGLTIIPFEYIETFSQLPSVQPYIVVEFYKYQYSGGAHGISELTYLTLNQTTSRLVTLESLFMDQVDYTSIINEKIRQEITKRQAQGEFFFTGSDGFQGIKADQPFFVNKNGDIVIVFNVYEIAPYASGPIFIVIPKDELKPYLK